MKLKNISKFIIVFVCALLINSSNFNNSYADDHTPQRKIINELKNYKVIYKTKFLNKMLNKYTEYPQNNFKKKYRLGYPCTIILKKNN